MTDKVADLKWRIGGLSARLRMLSDEIQLLKDQIRKLRKDRATWKRAALRLLDYNDGCPWINGVVKSGACDGCEWTAKKARKCALRWAKGE
jgi:hypothetical protein